MDALQPEVVVISNGTNRLHKHPRKVTIDRLQALPGNPDIYQANKFVDEANFPAVENLPDDFIADLDSDGPEGTILLELRAGGFLVVPRVLIGPLRVGKTADAPMNAWGVFRKVGSRAPARQARADR